MFLPVVGCSAPLRRAHGLLVSPPRATHFGKRPKVGKGLAPAIRLFASRKVPSVLRSFRGPPRRAIHGQSRLPRHPCRSPPETPITFGLLKGALGACGCFSGRLTKSQSESRSRGRSLQLCRSELAREPHSAAAPAMADRAALHEIAMPMWVRRH